VGKTNVTALRLHRQLAIVELGALLPLLLAIYLHGPFSRSEITSVAVLAFVLGVAYVQLVEYSYHRFLMHRGLRFLGSLKRSHVQHHRTFHGDRFCSRKEEDLKNLATRWYLFPATFAFHYLILGAILPSGPLVAFLGGATLHYAIFEITHWFTHVQDNLFDRCLRTIPVLGRLRELQVRHHRRHHETPYLNFNLVPPFLGDHLADTLAAEEPKGAEVGGPIPVPGDAWGRLGDARARLHTRLL
jgi:hypothetical protein